MLRPKPLVFLRFGAADSGVSRDVFRLGGTKSKPTVCTVNCRPWCSKLWDLRISRTDSLYQWRGLNQTKRGGGGAFAAGKRKFSSVGPRLVLVKATSLVQTVGSANPQIQQS